MNEKNNLLNHKFGRWTAIDDAVTNKNKSNRNERKWLCRCECGNEVEVGWFIVTCKAAAARKKNTMS